MASDHQSPDGSSNKKPHPLVDHNGVIPSGVGRMMPYIVIGLCALTIVYVVLVSTFDPQAWGLQPNDSFCATAEGKKDDTCKRSDLFAFQMSSFLAIVICGPLGFYTWHISRKAHTGVPQTPEGRLFEYLPEAELLATVCFTFQIWDFFISLLIPEHRTAIMLSHHFMAATVSWCSIRYQYLHHYGVFFLGLSEFSSIFLVFVDLSNYFPPTPGGWYDAFISNLCGPLFAVSFILYRVIYWWPISIQLFRDAYHVLKSGQASKLRPGKEWVLYIFLCLNIPLGIMQLYWLTIIIEEVGKVLLASTQVEQEVE